MPDAGATLPVCSMCLLVCLRASSWRCMLQQVGHGHAFGHQGLKATHDMTFPRPSAADTKAAAGRRLKAWPARQGRSLWPQTGRRACCSHCWKIRPWSSDWERWQCRASASLGAPLPACTATAASMPLQATLCVPHPRWCCAWTGAIIGKLADRGCHVNGGRRNAVSVHTPSLVTCMQTLAWPCGWWRICVQPHRLLAPLMWMLELHLSITIQLTTHREHARVCTLIAVRQALCLRCNVCMSCRM